MAKDKIGEADSKANAKTEADRKAKANVEAVAAPQAPTDIE